MNAIEVLRRKGPMRASDLANAIGMTSEAVYTELVAAEAIGHARVRVIYCADGARYCEWEATTPTRQRDSETRDRDKNRVQRDQQLKTRLHADPRFAAWAAGAPDKDTDR